MIKKVNMINFILDNNLTYHDMFLIPVLWLKSENVCDFVISMVKLGYSMNCFLISHSVTDTEMKM